jgi:peptidoglycan/LPS O-acetylase OafA/YrhL
MSPRRRLTIASFVTSIAALLVALPSALGATIIPDAAIRFTVLLAFVITAPGTVLLGLLEPDREELSAATVVAVGLASGAVLGQLLLIVGGTWRPAIVLTVAAAACVLLLARSEARHAESQA